MAADLAALLMRSRFPEEYGPDERAALPESFHSRWRQVSAGEDAQARFDCLLRALDEDPPRSDFGPAAEVLRCIAARTRQDPPFSSPSAPLPFTEIFGAITAAAWESRPLPPPAFGSGLQSSLERSLLILWQDVLLEEFNKVRPPSATRLTRLLGDRAGSLGRGCYDRFVAHHLATGLVELFDGYPAAARATAELILNWRRFVENFLRTFAADWPLLRAEFGVEGDVLKLETGLSDPHRGARTVCRLEFENGLRVLFKPRQCKIDRAFEKLLQWLKRKPGILPLRSARTLDRGEYGWLEDIRPAPCRDGEEIERFHRRIGQFAALLYLLKAADFHSDNWIFSGEHPVPIDLETLCHPDLPGLTESPFGVPSPPLHGTVLDSLLPPRWVSFGDQARDFSPLTCSTASPRVSRWTAVNTDAMARLFEKKPATAPDSRVLSAAEQEAVLHGFREMAEVLEGARAELLEGPLREFEAISVRLVIRPTEYYGCLLTNSLTPEALRSGLERARSLGHLGRLYTQADNPAALAPLLRAEHHDLSQLDIPLFTANTSHTHIETAEGRRIPGMLPQSPMQCIQDLLRDTDRREWRKQEGLLKAAFELHSPPDGATVRTARETTPEAEALRLGKVLRNEALRLRDGGWGWLAPLLAGETSRRALQPLGWGLYEGRLGAAIFFMALFRRTGNTEWRSFSFAIIEPLRRWLQTASPAAPLDPALSLGLADGIGSLVYSLTLLSVLGNEPQLLQEAEIAGRLLTRERLAKDVSFDLLGGAAGELLAQLALHQTTRSPDALERAGWCAEHLVRMQKPEAGGHAWPSHFTGSLAGFSHGVAGITLALARWNEKAPDPQVEQCIRNALVFERSHFYPDRSNWRDLRQTDDVPQFMTAWCHGAPGIALARTLLPPSSWDACMEKEIAAAMENTLAAEPIVDHLCCGTIGCIEILAEVGRRRGENAWLLAAHERLARTFTRDYRLLADEGCSLASPGFFTGLAGIGYTLLRLNDPSLPSVAAFEISPTPAGQIEGKGAIDDGEPVFADGRRTS